MKNLSRNDAIKKTRYDLISGKFLCDSKQQKNKEKNHSQGYKTLCVCGVQYLSHRLAFFIINGYLPKNVDHINGVKNDNRPLNLREATKAQNGWNMKKSTSNSSGVKGVYWSRNAKKWAAEIYVNGKHVWLGLHLTLSDAAKAVSMAREEYHGEYRKD